METLLIIEVDIQRFAFPAKMVERVCWAMRITPLAGQPRSFLGVITIEEVVIPVVDLRYMAGLPEKELDPANDFIILRRGDDVFAVIADKAEEVVDCNHEQLIAPRRQMDSFASSLYKSEEGIIVVLDPVKLVSEKDFASLRQLVGAIPAR